MSGRIPESFIETLLDRTDIVELIERHVPLKRAGREYQARCPFHEEKTPSFTVSPQKQFYHCFGCGAHGSAIGFLMNYEGLEFVDAVEELARANGLEVPREGGSRPRPAEGLYEILEASAEWYRQQLRDNPAAVEYLKGRGLSGEIAMEFGIGYAPGGWDGLMRQLGGNDDKIKLLQRAGMLSQGKSGLYDKFRKRIMFPIHDRRGRVIAFGGRAIDDDGPKYLNSPETELFHKGRELYGLYLARKGQGRMDRIVVVEGYMDVVALAQFGIRNVVATLGTATTGDHAEQLFRAADEVVYCFDGDRAGRKAAWRALEATLPRIREGRQARFLFLPDGEDPDSMVRSVGTEQFTAMLDDAEPLSEFFFDHFTAMVDMASIDGRARLVELARPSLQSIPEGIFRDMMTDRLSELARHEVAPRTGPARPANRIRSQTRRQSGGRGDGPRKTPMRVALAHLVQDPSLATRFEGRSGLEGSDLPGIDIWRELLEFCRSRPHITTAQLLELLRDHPAHAHLETLATWFLPGDADQRAREFSDAVTRLELQWLDREIGAMANISGLTTEEKERYRSLQARRQQLNQSFREGGDETRGG